MAEIPDREPPFVGFLMGAGGVNKRRVGNVPCHNFKGLEDEYRSFYGIDK